MCCSKRLRGQRTLADLFLWTSLMSRLSNRTQSTEQCSNSLRISASGQLEGAQFHSLIAVIPRYLRNALQTQRLRRISEFRESICLKKSFLSVCLFLSVVLQYLNQDLSFLPRPQIIYQQQYQQLSCIAWKTVTTAKAWHALMADRRCEGGFRV